MNCAFPVPHGQSHQERRPSHHGLLHVVWSGPVLHEVVNGCVVFQCCHFPSTIRISVIAMAVQSAIERATSEWQEKHALAQKVTMEEMRLEFKEKADLQKCVSLQQELFRVSLDGKIARLSPEEMRLVVKAKEEFQKLVSLHQEMSRVSQDAKTARVAAELARRHLDDLIMDE
jgi:spore coat polysaccharide biosynthesis protein SpsF (cytidylyltransferase family)